MITGIQLCHPETIYVTHSMRPHILATDSVAKDGVYLKITGPEWRSNLSIWDVEPEPKKGIFINLFLRSKKQLYIHTDEHIFLGNGFILVHTICHI